MEAWTRRQQTLQEALKAMVKPAEAMSQLMAALQRDVPAFAQLHHRTADRDASDEYAQKWAAIAQQFASLEDLVADLDNARDLHTLGLWPPLLALLHRSQPPPVRSQAAWVVGSAVQGVFAYSQRQTQAPTQRAPTGGAAQLLVAEDEALEESHRWLLEDFVLTLQRDAAEGDAAGPQRTNVTVSGLSLLVELLADHAAQPAAFAADGAKKALYALAASLRGSFEVQVALAELLQQAPPASPAGALIDALFGLATAAAADDAATDAAVSVDGAAAVTAHEALAERRVVAAETQRRVWALGADLATELRVVVDELRRLQSAADEAQAALVAFLVDEQLNATGGAALWTAAQRDAVQQLQQTLAQRRHDAAQALAAVRATPFAFARVFLAPRRFLPAALDALRRVTLQQTATLATLAARDEAPSGRAAAALRRVYLARRRLQRDALRFVAAELQLAQQTTQVDAALWTLWAQRDAVDGDVARGVDALAAQLRVWRDAETAQRERAAQRSQARRRALGDAADDDDAADADDDVDVVGGVDEDLVALVDAVAALAESP